MVWLGKLVVGQLDDCHLKEVLLQFAQNICLCDFDLIEADENVLFLDGDGSLE